MEIDINNLHNAYLLIGSRVEGEQYLSDTLEKIGIKEIGNSDFHSYRLESFDIESARDIKERAREKPFGQKQIFLIAADRFTHQAQNALLKTFEEPSDNVHFFVLLNAPDLLLPTLISRMQIIGLGQTVFGETLNPREFLDLDIKERLNFVRKFADKGKSLPIFLDSLLSFLNLKAEELNILNRVMNVRKFADDPSINSRLILEHLALVLN